MKDKIFLEQNAQDIYNIIDALQFYKDNAVMPQFNDFIDVQIQKIIAQIQVQGINIYKNHHDPKIKFGERVGYEGKQAIVVGMSEEAGFIKIAVANNNDLEIIDVPVILIGKES